MSYLAQRSIFPCLERASPLATSSVYLAIQDTSDALTEHSASSSSSLFSVFSPAPSSKLKTPNSSMFFVLQICCLLTVTCECFTCCHVFVKKKWQS